MSRRRLLLGAGLLALLSLGWMVSARLLWPDPVCPEAVERITVGMTAGEVEATFGRGADDVIPGRNFDHYRWLGASGSVWVTFDLTDGRATRAEFNPEWRRPSFADRLRRLPPW
jgi:hypothetical protein